MTRILYVDDEQDICEVASMALELDSAFEVETTQSGKEALTRVKSSRPDLILLDVMMPGMDGPTTLSKLRENPGTAGIPVVFVTARTQPAEVERLIAAGALGVIPKPFDPMTLAATVRSFL